MFDLKRIAGLAVGALLASAVCAQAAVVTRLQENSAAWATINTATTTDLGIGNSWASAPSTRNGNSGGVYRSVFDNDGPGAVGNGTLGDNSAYIGLDYFAVGPNNPANPAILKVAGGGAIGMRVLWGSPDSYNELTFWKDGLKVDTVVNTDIAPAPTLTGLGAVWVYISGIAGGTYDEAQFYSSPNNAFEFSNVEVVPLPAAGLLLLGGLAGLGFVSRKRKAA